MYRLRDASDIETRIVVPIFHDETLNDILLVVLLDTILNYLPPYVLFTNLCMFYLLFTSFDLFL